MEWTLGQAKRDFQAGFLRGFSIFRAPMGCGWSVKLVSVAGGSVGWLVDGREGAVREFKSLDSAVAAVESVGFQVTYLWQGAA